MIETYLLEQLDAVARCGTLLAASEELHITQPSMSRAMKKLEDLVGVELFEHRGNRLVLNDYGRIAADYARRILDSQEEMVTHIRMLERSRRTILLGSCAPGRCSSCRRFSPPCIRTGPSPPRSGTRNRC